MPARILDLKKNAEAAPAAAPARQKQGTGIVPGISWEAQEFEKHEKSEGWYALLAIVTAALIGLMALIRDYFAALLFAVAGVVVWLYAGKEPRTVQFAVTGRGVQVGDKVYLFGDLRSFWIFYDPPRKKELSLRSKHLFVPYIKIPLGDASPAALRRELIRFLPELKQAEALTDELARKVGF